MNILYFLEASVTLYLNVGRGRHLRQHLKDRTTNRSIEKMCRPQLQVQRSHGDVL